MKKKAVILASASPRRAQLLKEIMAEFEIIPSTIDESKISASSPKEFAVRAAAAKAREITQKYPDKIVIGADTIVALEGKILGKPKSKKEAFEMLKSLCGKTHQVITGIAIAEGENSITDLEITKVTMKKVSVEKIKAYVESGLPMDKAGSYGIQEIEGDFIESIQGDYNNVVGLPLKTTKLLLSKMQKI